MKTAGARPLPLVLYDLAYLRPGPAARDAAAALFCLVAYRLTGKVVEVAVEDYQRLTEAVARASGELPSVCVACGAEGRPYALELCRTCHRKLSDQPGAHGYDGRARNVLRGVLDTARRLDTITEGERVPRQVAYRLRAYPPERTLLLFALDLPPARLTEDAGEESESGDTSAATADTIDGAE